METLIPAELISGNVWYYILSIKNIWDIVVLCLLPVLILSIVAVMVEVWLLTWKESVAEGF